MKAIKRYLLIVFAALLFFQCGLDEEFDDPLKDNVEFMSFKADGVLKVYKGEGLVLYMKAIDSSKDITAVLVTGSTGDLQVRDGFSVIFSQIEPEGSTFRHPGNVNAESILAMYEDGQENKYSAGSLTDLAYQTQTTFELTVTSKGSKYYEGVFTAKLYSSELARYVEITEGKFKAKFEEVKN